MASFYFSKFFNENAKRYISNSPNTEYSLALEACTQMPTIFDARCFNIPKEEVTNLIYWRQLDAMRNSVQACGQALFSHKELMYKSCEEIKEMLIKADATWDSIPIFKQRGTCCNREDGQWVTNYSMPILIKEGREYLETLI